MYEREALVVNKTDDWSEFWSKIFAVVQYKLFGIFETKMSKIFGFFRVVSQYFGSSVKNTLIFFDATKLF